jgi:hypothetical protein
MPTTRERLKALHRAEPHLNQSELADRLHVTRQRVQQLAKSLELTLDTGPRGPGGRKVKEADPKPREPMAVPPGTTPAVAVLLTAADLTARGFTVFVPLTPTASCDLVAIDRNDRVERVVVRKARRAGEEFRYDEPMPDRSRSDRRAMILTDEPIRYEPAIRSKAK